MNILNMTRADFIVIVAIAISMFYLFIKIRRSEKKEESLLQSEQLEVE